MRLLKVVTQFRMCSKKWVTMLIWKLGFTPTRFKRHEMSVEDEGCPGSLKSIPILEMVDKGYIVVLCERRVKVKDIVMIVEAS